MSDEWVETTLGEVMSLNPEGLQGFEEGDVFRYVDIASVNESEGVRTATLTECTTADAPGRAKRRIRTGDVLVSTVRPNLRAFALVVRELDGEVASTGFCVLRSSNRILPGFAWCVIRELQFCEAMVALCTGSNYPAIRPADVAGFRFSLPPLSVQARIVNLLEHLDTLIANLEQEREAAESLLRSSRMAVFSDVALVRPLGELLELVIDNRGKTPRKLGTTFRDSGVPVISAINVKAGGLVGRAEPRFVDEHTYRKWMKMPTKEGDVILTSEGPLGSIARVVNDQPLVLGQRLFGLRGNEQLLLNDYLAHFLSSDKGQNALVSRSSGSTVRGIRQSELLKVPVPVPDLDAQRGDCAVLNEEARLHTLLSIEIRCLASFRSGLLSSLLSREIEIPDSYDELLGVAS